MKTLLWLLPLGLFLGCSSHITIGALDCPIDDMTKVESDLQECHIYNLDEVDKALGNKECKACLEAKGYKVITNSDANASQ